MIERQLRVPVDAERVWAALTEPDALAGWFGAAVEWDLRPGSAARFRGGGVSRDGLVAAVEPGRHLRFLWWPTGDRAGASEVTYDLDGDAEGTTLRVTERRLAAPAASAQPSTCATATSLAAERWTAADGAVLHVWSRCCAGVPVAGC
jgi:uncharacterized protein YndB with AHSA1/START domain